MRKILTRALIGFSIVGLSIFSTAYAKTGEVRIEWSAQSGEVYLEGDSKPIIEFDGSRVKDPQSLLRYGLPFKNKEVRQVSQSGGQVVSQVGLLTQHLGAECYERVLSEIVKNGLSDHVFAIREEACKQVAVADPPAG